MSTYKIGYARVSTLGQDEALQLDALQRAQVDRMFVDRASGAVRDRSALTSALECARPGDTLVVWRLDRLGRSLRHLIEVVKGLEERQVALVSLTESIDTSTPGGRLVFHVFGALAEFERDLIRKRTQAGLAAARARGRLGGRPTGWTADKLKAARGMPCGQAATTTSAALPERWASAGPASTGHFSPTPLDLLAPRSFRGRGARTLFLRSGGYSWSLAYRRNRDAWVLWPRSPASSMRSLLQMISRPMVKLVASGSGSRSPNNVSAIWFLPATAVHSTMGRNRRGSASTSTRC